MNSYRYQDIYSKIKKSIETNHYRAGKLLPTQEQLANEFNVSRVTIKKALNCLEKENLIYTKQGSGTYVKPRLDKFPYPLIIQLALLTLIVTPKLKIKF